MVETHKKKKNEVKLMVLVWMPTSFYNTLYTSENYDQ